jgi:hypothetical protein
MGESSNFEMTQMIVGQTRDMRKKRATARL